MIWASIHSRLSSVKLDASPAVCVCVCVRPGEAMLPLKHMMKKARRLPSGLRVRRVVVLELLSVSVPGDPSMFPGRAGAAAQVRRVHKVRRNDGYSPSPQTELKLTRAMSSTRGVRGRIAVFRGSLGASPGVRL